MTNEDSHSTNSGISGDEGHSDPLKVTVEGAARLSTPAAVMLRYNGNKRKCLTTWQYCCLQIHARRRNILRIYLKATK